MESNLLLHGLLTEACNTIVQALNDRELKLEPGSHFSNELERIQSDEKRQWMRSYVFEHTYWLLDGLIDLGFKLDVCVNAINPTFASVGEYVLLRSMLEYAYRLAYLTVLDIEANERAKRAIECAYYDLTAYEHLPSGIRSNSVGPRRQSLVEWYREITGGQDLTRRDGRPRRERVRDFFDDLGGPNQVWNAVVSDWPNDGRGQPMNPVYQSGYGIGSAISHGRAWAIRHFGLTKCSTEGEEPRWMPGLDSNSILNIQESGVRLLQHSFGYSVQLMHRGGLDTGTMNRLNRVIERIWESVDARDE